MDILPDFLYFLTMPQHDIFTYSRYLQPDADAVRWGFCVVDCGHAVIPPGADYAAIRRDAPAGHLFSWERGRTLDEYQLYYITAGRGLFESKPTGRVRVAAGQVFLIFPGVWHRFRPVNTVGWDENRIGFQGEFADRIMQGFFSPDKAVMRVGHSDTLKDLIQSVSGLMQLAPVGYQQVMGARTMEVLALVRSRAMNYHPTRGKAARKIEQARKYITKNYRTTVDLATLASELGMSYTRFRTVFKEQTGVSPHQYQLDVRMNLARHWLTESDLTLDRIAFGLGFKSTAYFSRIFKNKVGCPPGAFRKR